MTNTFLLNKYLTVVLPTGVNLLPLPPTPVSRANVKIVTWQALSPSLTVALLNIGWSSGSPCPVPLLLNWDPLRPLTVALLNNGPYSEAPSKPIPELAVFQRDHLADRQRGSCRHVPSSSLMFRTCLVDLCMCTMRKNGCCQRFRLRITNNLFLYWTLLAIWISLNKYFGSICHYSNRPKCNTD